MRFFEENNCLICRERHETIRIEAWGTSALRVRATQNAGFSGEDKGLEPQADSMAEGSRAEGGKTDGSKAEGGRAEIIITDQSAEIRNGKLRCVCSANGWLEFLNGDRLLLKEYDRNFRQANDYAPAMKVEAREFKPVSGSDYRITARFEADEKERIYGMGQYQQPNLNLKGCVLELAQRNAQISIPFYVSSKGYGFLWNHPGVGEVMFGANHTQWRSELAEELDYWVTADDTPKDILRNYTEVTGRAPEFPENALGLWQCKLRYRTQEEVLEVAREYKRRGIPLDVIVIDYFHWVRQGDWGFDPLYWPDPRAMMDELRDLGVRCMVSVWPTVDKKSVNFEEMLERGLLVRTEHGSMQCFDLQGDTVTYDATNPEARRFIWDRIQENYYRYGINMFWLDSAEPEFTSYDYENYRYYAGPALKVSNRYPREHAKGFYQGQKAAGQKDMVNLIRSAWVGSQKYAALVWSGDIRSNFATLRAQLSAGLNIGLAGIPWWTTDTGGFIGNITDEHFNELLIRWFEFSAFCPVLRMHGDRGPHDIPALSDLDYGGGFSETGHPNELWSYGPEVCEVLKKYLDLRLGMKDYIKSLMDEASENGSPVIRTMFYEFPEDEKCWKTEDQYMFGSRYLVAPVMAQGVTARQVYLPKGRWKNIHDGKEWEGGRTITAEAPIDIIPVYEKMR